MDIIIILLGIAAIAWWASLADKREIKKSGREEWQVSEFEREQGTELTGDNWWIYLIGVLFIGWVLSQLV
jgi:hypothetical protein